METQFRTELGEKIIGCAIEVHRTLGPGLLESAYEQCLAREFTLREIQFELQKPMGIAYKGITLDCGYRLDIVVEDEILLESKSVEKLSAIHEAQVLTYLKLSGLKQAFLINFNAPRLRDGLRSFLL